MNDITLLSGVTTANLFVPSDGWIIVSPSSGATCTVSYTNGTEADIAAGAATWVPDGSHTAHTAIHIEEALQNYYVRLTASGGDVRYRITGNLSYDDRLSLRRANITTLGKSVYASFAPQWRGMGQAMALAVQGFSGGASTSITHRTRHYSPVRFRRVRAVIQTFYPTGTPIADTNFATDYTFQVGFEKTYLDALTGIPPRRLFTFAGQESATYKAASPPDSGYILSDIMDIGSYQEANERFGLWTTVEAPSGTNVIPYTRNASNFINRYLGQVSGTANIAGDVARSASSVTAVTSVQTGASTYFTPCFLLVETDSELPFVAIIGDSLAYGVGEGNGGSNAFGDGSGSPRGNFGIVERVLVEKRGYPCVNFSRGSDGNKFLATAGNWAKRRKLLALANPTHVINANVHNDITPTITIANWAATTLYSVGAAKAANSNHYICTRGGISGSTAPSGTGEAFVDGTCTWAFLQAQPATSVPRGSSEVVGQMMVANRLIAETVPGVPIIAMVGTPDAASTDTWTTVVNQTVATGWGDATSRRGLVNGFIKARHPLLGITEFFDPSAVLEDSFPTQTSKWVVNGSASYVTNDGTHPNSTGYALFADSPLAGLHLATNKFGGKLAAGNIEPGTPIGDVTPGTGGFTSLFATSVRVPQTGTAALTGNATLVAGTVTVATTAATANAKVMLTRKTSGGTIGNIITYTITAGVSFTITSDNALDTSTFTWFIIEGQ